MRASHLTLASEGAVAWSAEPRAREHTFVPLIICAGGTIEILNAVPFGSPWSVAWSPNFNGDILWGSIILYG